MQKGFFLDEIETDYITIGEDEVGLRLDKILSLRFQDEKSRTYFQYLIEQQKVLLNGTAVKKRIQPKAGDTVEIHFIYPPQLSLEPEAIPLDVIFEDEHLIVVNKPAGMVVHPSIGNWSGTFVNALLHHCAEVKALIAPSELKSESVRPGIVHRLDKDTTGILIAAKHRKAHECLSTLFANRDIYKQYLAVCFGNPGNQSIDLPIGRSQKCYKQMAVVTTGKKALSHCQTLTFDGTLSLVSVQLVTGRTHQIRVHLQAVGTPVLGDPIYGNEKVNKSYKIQRQMLHAYCLRFTHPFTHEVLELKAPLPQEMAAFSSNWINNPNFG